jgi:Leucine-rich repeat (LRR) protein
MGLWASDNQLTSLDVSKNAELDELDVSNNQLYELAAIT